MHSFQGTGEILAMNAQARCVHCGHTALLLLVFGERLIQRARVGCSCGSFLLHYSETEQILHDPNELMSVLEARSGTHTDSRASVHAAPHLWSSMSGRRGAISRPQPDRISVPLAKKQS